MDNLGIGGLAAILAAAGVTIYVLGLIGLAIPIRRIFTDNISTAWYAVSLSPKTVVAGQGVRIWTQWLIVIAALTLLYIAALRTMEPANLWTSRPLGQATPFVYSMFLGGVITLSLLVARRNTNRMLVMGLLPRSYLGGRRQWLEYAFYALLAAAGAMLITLLVIYVNPEGREGDSFFRNYIMILFVGSLPM